jgi:hypothetical protein
MPRPTETTHRALFEEESHSQRPYTEQEVSQIISSVNSVVDSLKIEFWDYSKFMSTKCCFLFLKHFVSNQRSTLDFIERSIKNCIDSSRNPKTYKTFQPRYPEIILSILKHKLLVCNILFRSLKYFARFPEEFSEDFADILKIADFRFFRTNIEKKSIECDVSIYQSYVERKQRQSYFKLGFDPKFGSTEISRYFDNSKSPLALLFCKERSLSSEFDREDKLLVFLRRNNAKLHRFLTKTCLKENTDRILEEMNSSPGINDLNDPIEGRTIVFKCLETLGSSNHFSLNCSKAFTVLYNYLQNFPSNDIHEKRRFIMSISWQLVLFLMKFEKTDIIPVVIDKLIWLLKLAYGKKVRFIFDLVLYLKTMEKTKVASLAIDKITGTTYFKNYLKEYFYCTFKIQGERPLETEFINIPLLLINECKKLVFRVSASIYKLRTLFTLRCIKWIIGKFSLSDSQIIEVAGMSHFIMQIAADNQLFFFDEINGQIKRTILKIISTVVNLRGVCLTKDQGTSAYFTNQFSILECQSFDKYCKFAVKLLNKEFLDLLCSDQYYDLFIQKLNVDIIINDAERLFNDSADSQKTEISTFSDLIKGVTTDKNNKRMQLIRTLFLLISDKCQDYAVYVLPMTVYQVLDSINSSEAIQFAEEVRKILNDNANQMRTGLVLCLNFLLLQLGRGNKHESELFRGNCEILKGSFHLSNTRDVYSSLELNSKLIYEMERYYTNCPEKISEENLNLYLETYSKINPHIRMLDNDDIKDHVFVGDLSVKPQTRSSRSSYLSKLKSMAAEYKNNERADFHKISVNAKELSEQLSISTIYDEKETKWVFRALDMLSAVALTAGDTDRKELRKSILCDFFTKFEAFLSNAFRSTFNLADTNTRIIFVLLRFYFYSKLLRLILKQKMTMAQDLIRSVFKNIEKYAESHIDLKHMLKSISYISSFLVCPSNDLFLHSSLKLSKFYRKSKNFKKSKFILNLLEKRLANAQSAMNPFLSLEFAKVAIRSGATFESARIAYTLVQAQNLNVSLRYKALKLFMDHNLSECSNSRILEIYNSKHVNILVSSSEVLTFQKALYTEARMSRNFHELFELLQLYMRACIIGNKHIMQTIPKVLEIMTEILTLFARNSNHRETSDRESSIRKLAKDFISKVPGYKLVIHQQAFISRLTTNQAILDEFVQDALSKIIDSYPVQSMWWFLGILYLSYPRVNQKNKSALSIMNKIHYEVRTVYKAYADFVESFINEFASKKVNYNFSKINQEILRLRKVNIELILPLRKFLCPSFPTENNGDDFQLFKNGMIFINKIAEDYTVVNSKEASVKISFVGSNNRHYSFVVKSEPASDVRKETRHFYFIEYLNFLFGREKLTSDEKFQLITFNILSLTRYLNIIEWVEKSRTIGSLFDDANINTRKYSDYIDHELNTYPEWAFNTEDSEKSVIKEFIFAISPNEMVWNQNYLNFVKSWASWSVFCFVIGLGNRHYYNVLILDESAQTIQIDFDCIFHKGLRLGCPKTVDFRLSANVMKALGVTECWGLFRYYFKILIEVCVKNVDNIMANLEVFVIDPLIDYENSADWHRNRIDDEHLKTLKIKDQKLQLNDIRRNLMRFATNNIDEEISRLLVKNSDISTLQKMSHGWSPHL